ncbi:MAG: NADH-quinone oxidoreductase subunit A [Nevskiaceae bacterium]|nr:MAG: NADH-quinone oxidoreductase subunit A [Nevskiaceae bacterium]TBR73924.1 MAG: NADH-quinone oxidoreductase subunit A [Nevskiaceae bacterium]
MGPYATLVENWSFALYVLAVIGITALMLGLSWLLGGRTRGGARDDIFESGIVSVGGGHLRFPAKFYLVAMFFVVFDLEAVFLYAWAVSARETGWAGYIEAAIFMLILFAGLIYLWRQGGLDWGPASHRRRMNLPVIDGRLPAPHTDRSA